MNSAKAERLFEQARRKILREIAEKERRSPPSVPNRSLNRALDKAGPFIALVVWAGIWASLLYVLMYALTCGIRKLEASPSLFGAVGLVVGIVYGIIVVLFAMVMAVVVLHPLLEDVRSRLGLPPWDEG